MFIGQQQEQLQLNQEVQEMYIKYKDLCDIFLSILATVENLVKEEKKYENYDEFNSGKHNNENGLALQFLRLQKIFKENISDFELEDKHYELAKNYNFIDEKTNKFLF